MSNTITTFFNRFSKPFWTANFVEFCERAAYYGVFIVLTMYLSNVLGFTDIEGGWIAGVFSGGLYFLPTFSGAYADKIGFRKALILAFALLTVGYVGLGLLPTMLEGAGLVEYTKVTVWKGLPESSAKWIIVPILLIIMVGGSFIKSVITGTISKETTTSTRALGFSIFYTIVNLGAFLGKAVVKPIRVAMGSEGLVILNYFAAGMTLVALIVIILFFKSTNRAGEGKSISEVWSAFLNVLTNGKLILLIVIITGFWMVQQQLYATMPKYVIRLAGESSSPSWYANVNPLIVALTAGFVTYRMRNKTPLLSMTVGMFLMPISAFLMATGSMMGSETILTMHPVAFMMVMGICVQGLAESFISPRFLEYFSLQAPKGEEGLYLGFSHLHSFLSSIVGFGLSGYLLTEYCPDPTTLTEVEKLTAYDNAHYIWYVFVGVALFSAIALVVFGKLTKEKKS